MISSNLAFDPPEPNPLSAYTNTYTTNELNQYTSIQSSGSSIQLTYDVNGNLTNGGKFVYTYDAENRLISVTPLDPQNGDKKTEYAYDYMSRRVRKNVFEWQTDHWSLLTEHGFVYDGWNLIKEQTIQGSQTTTEYYVWGLDLSGTLQGAGGIGGLLSKTNGVTSETFLYTFDANGNVGQLVDSSTGTIAAHYEYDPFGKLLVATGSEADSNVFRFSTKYFDVETGLCYYGYRYYNLVLGRWQTRDPIGEEGGLNVYVFVVNDPINRFDRFGQIPQDRCEEYCGQDVTDWLIREMNRNANSEIVKWLYSQRYRVSILTQIKRFATWASLVGPRREWDHKPDVQFMLDKGLNEGICPTEKCKKTITLCDMCFDYDVPSNIHYGYVGRHAGFSEIVLVIGPVVVQEGGKGIKGKIDAEAEDTPAIQVGFDTYDFVTGWSRSLPTPIKGPFIATQFHLCEAVEKRKSQLKQKHVFEECKLCKCPGYPTQ